MQVLIFKWLWWQFFEVPKNIFKAWKNFLRFGLNYFSIPLLLKTFFSPWRRYKVFYPRGFDPWAYFETFFSNLIFRTIGAILRSVLIIIGVFFEIFVFFAGLFMLFLWYILPFILLWGFYHGIRLIL